MLTPFFELYDKSMIEKVRPLLQMMGKVTPDKLFPLKGSETPKMHMKEWNEDHLNLGFSITPHNILQNDKAMKLLDSENIFEKQTIPSTLVIRAGKDKVVCNKKIEEMYDTLKIGDKQIITYDETDHNLL